MVAACAQRNRVSVNETILTFDGKESQRLCVMRRDTTFKICTPVTLGEIVKRMMALMLADGYGTARVVKVGRSTLYRALASA